MKEVRTNMFHLHMPGIWFPLTAAGLMLGGMVQGVIWAAKEARNRHRPDKGNPEHGTDHASD